MNRVILFLFATLMLAMPLQAKRSHYAKTHRSHASAVAKDTASQVAYSDTTSFAQPDSMAVDSSAGGNVTLNNGNLYFDDPSDFITFISGLVGIGTVGVVIALLIAIACLIFALAPFVLFGFLVYLIVDHHNEKRRLARMAMMSGQTMPQDIVRKDVETDYELWRRGLKHIFFGLGIAVLCYCLGAYQLAGIGWLAAIYGVGLAVIARTSKKVEDNGEGCGGTVCEKENTDDSK